MIGDNFNNPRFRVNCHEYGHVRPELPVIERAESRRAGSFPT